MIFIANKRMNLAKTALGKTFTIKIDRPLGSCHPDHPELKYPINYGYLPDIFAADGEEMDVYLLGVNKPVTDFKGQIIAVIHRLNDVEDKLVAAPLDMMFTKKEISHAVHFQEQFFETEIEVLPRKNVISKK